MAVFSKDEARRFAALMAGFDTGNPSEAEAMTKARVLRRMATEKNIRLVDAWELAGVRDAIDEQLEPIRAVATTQVVSGEYEPWPLQMMWFFVGIVAWCFSAIFLLIKIVGAFALGCVVGFVEGVTTWRNG